MPRIALATYAAAPELTADDGLLRTALESVGVEVHPAIWDEAHDWAAFDLVVLRSTWDYFFKSDQFAAWLDRLDREGAVVLNPLDVVRWNGDKRYLMSLQELGVEVVPTVFVEYGDESAESLASLLVSQGWTEAVVKPAISGGAHDTWRTSIQTAAADQSKYEALRGRRNGGLLVQPYMPEIVTGGELSLIFIDGVYSHAALKRPKAGDFRVQQEHGGLYSPCAPSAAVVDRAAYVLAAASAAGLVPIDLLYARVDGIVRNDGATERFLLMELECIEPSLFFMQHPPAAARMAGSLLERIAQRANR